MSINLELMKNLLYLAIEAALDAGNEILKIYNSENFNTEFKDDKSPLTQADKNAHQTIMSYLNQTSIHILSEEGKHLDYNQRQSWEQLWLVDPLDGTKEFIKKNDEFTVNIALIKNEKPVLGVIYVPVLKQLYFGTKQIGAYKTYNIDIKKLKELKAISKIIEGAKKLPEVKNENEYVVVASRSHLSDETKEFIDELKTKYPSLKLISKGSSLKLCAVAEGMANIYPRFGPTMEWDTAAGHAIAESAGKIVISTEGNQLMYNKENLLNPYFIVK